MSGTQTQNFRLGLRATIIAVSQAVSALSATITVSTETCPLLLLLPCNSSMMASGSMPPNPLAVTDAATCGHHCLKVHAVIPNETWPEQEAPVFGLLDCRPLLQGWSLIEAPHGRASYSDLVTVLDTFAPPGLRKWILLARTQRAFYLCMKVRSLLPPMPRFLMEKRLRPMSFLRMCRILVSTLPILTGYRTKMMWPAILFLARVRLHRGLVADLRLDPQQTATVHSTCCSPHQWRETPPHIHGGAGGVARWEYNAPPAFGPQGPTNLLEGDTAAAQDPDICHVPFYIAVPGYQLSHVIADLPLPAIPAEALAAVREVRPQSDRRRFPILTAVRPQTVPGAGILIAGPMWDEETPTICIDTSALDGRYFATKTRTYADRYTLLMLADLPLQTAVDVYVGTSDSPFSDGGEQHLMHGEVISFVRQGSRVPPWLSFGEILGSARFWTVEVYTPPVARDGNYCLVHDSQGILHLPGDNPRTQYRRHIAACLGTNESRLRLFPASPEVSDAFVAGCPVRAVIAIAEPGGEFTRSSFCVLLDSRPISHAWHELHVHDGFLDCDRCAPPGWRAIIVAYPALSADSVSQPDESLLQSLSLLAEAVDRPRKPLLHQHPLLPPST
ncbi:unnamed protein product [Symbiodinium sp. CCMP2592]|nr:unnamed protein product [Symbiodinium sp. CCMP2592]